MPTAPAAGGTGQDAMDTSDDFTQPENSGELWQMPVDVFRAGSMLLFAPLDGSVQPSARLLGLGLMVLGAPLALVCMPLLALLTFVLFSLSALWMFYAGETAQFSSEGVVVSSRRRGSIARLNWNAIACARHCDTPPFGLWEIVLRTGDAVPLPMVEGEALIVACKAAGVPVRRDDRGAGDIRRAFRQKSWSIAAYR